MQWKKLIKPLALIFVLWALSSCWMSQSSTCEEDRHNGDWGKIVDNNDCTRAQQAEAYLALGGFDFIKLITNQGQSFMTLFGIDANNWQVRYGYFKKALELTRPVYLQGDDIEQTIYFFASFMSLVTHLSGNLDNGEGGQTAMDGTIEQAEIAAFTGATPTTGGGDGATLVDSGWVQFKYNDIYYMSDGASVYQDDQADGLADGAALGAVEAAALLAAVSSWSEANQVVYVDAISDPISGAVNVEEVTDFSANLLLYLTDVKNAMLAIGTDASSDSIATIDGYRSQVDNGASCELLETNPALRVAELLVGNSRKDSRGASESYASDNLVDPDELTALGEDTALTAPSEITVEPKLKLLFYQSVGVYIPYWFAAHDDVKIGMASLQSVSSSGVKSDDGQIAFSEIICMSDVTSTSAD